MDKKEDIKVLLLDDDSNELLYIKRFIEKIDKNIVIEALTSPEAAKNLITEEPFDCIVSDYLMFGMDGIELARWLKQRKGTPFILYTGRGSEQVVEEAFAAGVDDYLIKDMGLVHFEKLVERIHRAIEKKRRKDPSPERDDRHEIWLRNVFAASPDAITVTDLNGNLVECNQATLDVHGFQTKGEVIGRNALELIAERDRGRALENLKRTLEQGTIKNLEYTFLTRDGREFPAELSASVILDESGNPAAFVGITKDITERKRARAEMERLTSDLEEYTYSVSHDLRAPLRALIGYSELLLRECSKKIDGEAKGYVERINKVSKRMEKLVDDLLTLSRVGRKHMDKELINLNDLIEDIKSENRDLLKESGAKIVHGELPALLAPAVWMRQLFENLISNGIKFNNSTGPEVEVSCVERPFEYQFQVKDNGIGIAEKDRERVFKLFQRLHTEEEYPGTGAGLSICKKIVERLGGRIWVEGQPDEGSTFHFTYPKEQTDDIHHLEDPIIEKETTTGSPIDKVLAK